MRILLILITILSICIVNIDNNNIDVECTSEALSIYRYYLNCRYYLKDITGQRVILISQRTIADYSTEREQTRITWAYSVCVPLVEGYSCKRIRDNYDAIPTPWNNCNSAWTKFRISDDLFIKKITNTQCFPEKGVTKCRLQNTLW